MSELTQHRITNVYQAPLINALLEVLRAESSGSLLHTWMALDSLYGIMPPDAKGDVKKEYDIIVNNLRIAQNRNRNNDPLIQQINQTDAMNVVLAHSNSGLKASIVKALFDHHYFENPGPQPKLQGERHL